jgi:4-alpha-glucanotransferase
MKTDRSAGILLHVTSLPDGYGIGDLGPAAYRWVEWLAGSGCSLWQVLPLGPTGYGDSPYQCFSAMAGNPYLISPDLLLERDLLGSQDLADAPAGDVQRVDYGKLCRWKPALLERAYRRFCADPDPALAGEFEAFRAQNAGWLGDFALFIAIKEVHGDGSWEQWPAPLRRREPEALAQVRRDLADRISFASFTQFLFSSQWAALRAYAASRGVKLIGDVPLFAAYDSADVWAHPELFVLDEAGRPAAVAGVPPDYFSSTGQLWGNPLYRWEAHRESGYGWWLDRLRQALTTVDLVRLDHFRGLAAYWEIPADAATAESGRWVPGPGAELLQAAAFALGTEGQPLPFIAEDLGIITTDVIALRDRFHLPGMKVLQFAFTGPDNPFLPHHYPEHCVVYTGTHDNDTSRGWLATAPTAERDFALVYLDSSGDDFAWDLIRAAWASPAVLALAPMQDILSLGSEARMNYPSRLGGNWQWRMPGDALDEPLQERLKELNRLYQRK